MSEIDIHQKDANSHPRGVVQEILRRPGLILLKRHQIYFTPTQIPLVYLVIRLPKIFLFPIRKKYETNLTLTRNFFTKNPSRFVDTCIYDHSDEYLQARYSISKSLHKLYTFGQKLSEKILQPKICIEKYERIHCYNYHKKIL
jgi:hypothetical protein